MFSGTSLCPFPKILSQLWLSFTMVKKSINFFPTFHQENLARNIGYPKKNTPKLSRTLPEYSHLRKEYSSGSHENSRKLKEDQDHLHEERTNATRKSKGSQEKRRKIRIGLFFDNMPQATGTTGIKKINPFTTW